MSEETMPTSDTSASGFQSFFQKRELKFLFTKIPFKASSKPRTFADGSWAKVLKGHEAQVSITINSGEFLGECVGSITNVNDVLVNELSTLGMYPKPSGTINIITIYASNDFQSGYHYDGNPKEPPRTFSKVFEGTIDTAAADYNSQPNPKLIFTARANGGFNFLPSKPVSFMGEVKVADIFQAIIANINSFFPADAPPIKVFQNLGVEAVEKNPYYRGDAAQQLAQCASNNHVDQGLENGILSIWPQGKAPERKGSPQNRTLLLSYMTGMIGYPRYSQQGVIVETVYRNDLNLTRPYYIDSNIKKACGRYDHVIRITHNLSCLTAGGPWSSEIELSTFGTNKGFGSNGN